LTQERWRLLAWSFGSVTGDVYSIRAKRIEEQIHYRIVDEYDSEFEFDHSVANRPLTLGELAERIDSATNEGWDIHGLVQGFWERNLNQGEEPEEAVKFAVPTSEFYKDLEALYAAGAQAWIQRPVEE
jgi:hypothetical protein